MVSKETANAVKKENERLANLKKTADEKRWNDSKMTSSQRNIQDAGKK